MQSFGSLTSEHRLPDTALPLPSTVRQIDALQLLRAIAVILVIWCHAGQFLNSSGSHDLPNLGVFGIDLFFVISGFILSLTVLRQKGSPGTHATSEFMKRRILRIYPIYWFVAVLTLIRLALSHQIFRHDYLPAFFLMPSFQYPGSPAILSYSWTMNFEVFFYFVLGMLLLRTIRQAVPILILLLIGLVLAGVVVGIRHPVINLAANPILLEFVFGAGIALLYARFGGHRLIGVALALCGTAAVVYVSQRYLPMVATGAQMIMVDQGVFSRVATWGVCAAMIVGGTVFWSPSLDSAAGRLWVLIGNASYSIYLVSALGLEYSTRLFFKLDPPPQLSLANRVLYVSSVLIAVMVLGMACYLLVERPMLRFLNRKFLRKPTSAPARTLPANHLGTTGHRSTEPTLDSHSTQVEPFSLG